MNPWAIAQCKWPVRKYGPPRDRNGAARVLHEAIEAGVNHIDTADYYGPHVTNQIVRQALLLITPELR